MNRSGTFSIARVRMIAFIAVGILHVTLITSVAFHIKTTTEAKEAEPVAGVMRLLDVQEDYSMPPPPPPPEIIPDTPVTNTLDAVAEYMIESDVITAPVLGAPGGRPGGVAGSYGTGDGPIDYLPQRMISQVPELPEDQIRRNTVYPAIAQRSGIEGTVYLELFIDRLGNVRNVSILRENPSDRGFGEAAVNAFRGIHGKPAEANGEPVAVRFRYVLRFTLR